MRTLRFIALAVAAVLSIGASISSDDAVARAIPSAAAAVARPDFVRLAVNVCGSNGCVRVETKRVQHYRPNGPPPRRI